MVTVDAVCSNVKNNNLLCTNITAQYCRANHEKQANTKVSKAQDTLKIQYSCEFLIFSKFCFVKFSSAIGGGLVREPGQKLGKK